MPRIRLLGGPLDGREASLTRPTLALTIPTFDRVHSWPDAPTRYRQTTHRYLATSPAESEAIVDFAYDGSTVEPGFVR
jgi:hypothetical protein